MPTESEHLSKAKQNRHFADALKSNIPTSAGWALTPLFYSALHYVEAYNAKFGLHCKNHGEVKDNIARNPVLCAIFDDYEDLLTFSWNARYQAVAYGESEITEARSYQEAVATHISRLLGS